jgi:hypothetical protein
MAYFFILLFWLLCVIVGLAMLVTVRFRYMSLYLVIGSTLGLILSAAASTGFLWVSMALLGQLRFGGESPFGVFLVLAGSLFCFVVGGLIGIALGAVIAFKLNRLIGWRQN